MIFLSFCLLVAAGFLAANLLTRRYPFIRCALYGHDAQIEGVVMISKDLKWCCRNCGRRVVL